MMHRRAFLSTLGFGILGLPLVGAAPPTGRVPRVGVLSPKAPGGFEALRQGLRDLGYVEGQSIRIEPRFAEPRDDMADLAASLVRDNVDIIVTDSTGAAVAAKQVTQTIPIVMAVVGDPVEFGLVASLARPGGNITGIASLSGEISGKRLELQKEAIPRLVRVAVLWNPTNTPSSTLQVKNLAQAARSLAIQIQLLEARDAPDFDGAFQAAVRGRAQAVLATADALFSVHRARLAELALDHRLPMFGSDTGFSAAGALMNFGANIFEAWRRSAVYVDKILKGAKPADLPVEQPTKFELVINLKTAKALGLTIPQSLLLRADQLIE